mmetsp:Transcript_20857/g.14978  ORF Transcript_20857/g.14978 Transcript_20857/m.14978 type:complete len:156 (+) Transcript_20857:979-1446(+)
MQAEDQGKNKSEINDFNGKVVEIHSGDSVTVERDNDFETVRVFLATVKAPVLNKKENEEADPYAWESKETLRKMAIGKKVRVEMEYAKTTQAGLTMNFATIFMQKNNKSLSVNLLEKGLLATNVMKNGENASKYLEDLLAAEKKASVGKQGIHSN